MRKLLRLSRQRWTTGAALIGAAAAMLGLLAVSASSLAHTASPDNHTTEEQSVTQGPLFDAGKPGFFQLAAGPGSPRVVREVQPGMARTGRQGRRGSLAYFAQLTDFQLADEESPARVEFVDRGAASAWRPHEGFHPFAIDYSFRQLNNFTDTSPHSQAGRPGARMDFALMTGDQSDNQQYNETEWVRQLAEGGQPLNPNSGIKSDYAECSPDAQAALLLKEGSGALPNEPVYTGVQDYSDYFQAEDYYDPDEPAGQFANWPRYTGLMDRAQFAFTPVGLRRSDNSPVPSYVANGNHDGLVQGNEDAIRAYEEISTGCFKPFVTTTSPPFSPGGDPDPSPLLTATTGFFVRPDDPGRRFVDRIELKKIYGAGIQPDDHGFKFVSSAENQASNFAASYYAWDGKPGIRFISIDTTADGGVVEDSSNGNIDDPQFEWLTRELEAAERQNKLVVTFGHHPIRSLTADAPDELAQPCTGRYESADGEYQAPAPGKDEHGHDVNPGCDLDPRLSTPVHQGADLQGLLSRFPNVLTYVAGHTHENKVLACGSSSGCQGSGNWWEVNTSAVADWPQQNRLVEVMDNRDGTLSIFGTLLDHASELAIPPSTADSNVTGAFSTNQLASLGRSFSYNDPQSDKGNLIGDPPTFGALGNPEDRNVELLVRDPRRGAIDPPAGAAQETGPTPSDGGRTITGTSGNDRLIGTPGNDVIICGDGDDRVIAGAGDDFIDCGDGDDTINSGPGDDLVRGGAGDDFIRGSSGDDRLSGGSGNDRVGGGSGADQIAGDSGNDRIAGNEGRDFIIGGSGNDNISGNEANDRIRGGSGRDRASGNSGNDRINGNSGRDRLSGNSGNDRLAGGSSNDRINGNSGNDRLFGDSGNDRLRGGSGRDRLFGGSGRDRLAGGTGRDRLAGGTGRDRLRGGPGRDRVSQR